MPPAPVPTKKRRRSSSVSVPVSVPVPVLESASASASASRSASPPVSASAPAPASPFASPSASASVARSTPSRERPSSGSCISRSTAFSEPVRTAIKQCSSWACFACGARRPLEAAHVIQKHDSAVDLLRERGLLNFNINAVENGVALCASCHTVFDHDDDPAFIFWPLDIDFFIEREIQFRQTDPDNRPAQRIPSALEYANHNNNINTTSSGLYQRFFLDLYMSPILAINIAFLNERLGMPSPWHGAPFASLRRAFTVIGSPRINVVPLELEKKLITLKNLYYRDDFRVDDIPMAIPTNKVAIKDDRDQSTNKTLATRKGLGDSAFEKNLRLPKAEQEEWILGPSSTSQQIMERFGPSIAEAAANPINFAFSSFMS